MTLFLPIQLFRDFDVVDAVKRLLDSPKNPKHVALVALLVAVVAVVELERFGALYLSLEVQEGGYNSMFPTIPGLTDMTINEVVTALQRKIERW